MARVLILLIVLGAVLVTATTLSRALSVARIRVEDHHLPKSVQTLSYILLIALMFGVVTGLLGGL